MELKEEDPAVVATAPVEWGVEGLDRAEEGVAAAVGAEVGSLETVIWVVQKVGCSAVQEWAETVVVNLEVEGCKAGARQEEQGTAVEGTEVLEGAVGWVEVGWEEGGLEISQ